MRPFVTAEEMSRLDRETMSALSISSFDLMNQVAAQMQQCFLRRHTIGDILFLCGPGNNGGDGYRVAELLRQSGRRVFVWEVLPAQSADCQRAKALFRGEYVQGFPKECDFIVDAIFGSGGRADLPQVVQVVLKEANRRKALRISLDIPTGVDSISGQVHPQCFLADETLVVAFPKSVFLREEVMETLGHISFVGEFFSQPQETKLVALEESDFCMPIRKRTGHKGLYGRCGIIGGSSKTPGAALLAAEAAYRAGAGYSTLYFAKDEGLRLKISDASFLYRLKWKLSDLGEETALVVGCGGMPNKFRTDSLKCPIVVDADALIHWKRISKTRGAPVLFTPHPGEAARMLGSSSNEVQKDRHGALQELTKLSRQSIYLKGAPGLLKFSEAADTALNKSYVNLYANPIFSKAGSGDVLAGILGGFLAQAFAKSRQSRVTEHGDGARGRSKGDGANANAFQGVRLIAGKRGSAGKKGANRGSEQFFGSLVPEQSKLERSEVPVPEQFEVFRRAVISGLSFQRAVGEVLAEKRGTMASDQLDVFSEAFRRLDAL